MTENLSVVIPTLDAELVLPGTLAALSPVADLVVVDGGSRDGTVAVARAAGARVLRTGAGRGIQIAAGIAAARGAWVLILHADTRLAPGWTAAVAAHVRSSERAAHFRFRLDSADPRARRLERAVDWRCRWIGLPYGDQGLLVSRARLAAAGGMRAWPLMEDVDLVRRLGPITGLPVDAVTSAARWERDGWWRRSARNLVCLTLWRIGVPPHAIVKLYAKRPGIPRVATPNPSEPAS